MWLNRLRWYLRVQFKRRRIGYKHRPVRYLPLAVYAVVALAGFLLLSSIWKVFMNGFLVSTPWIPGTYAGTYYIDSIKFAFKSTLIIGSVFLLVTFLLGIRFNKMFRR